MHARVTTVQVQPGKLEELLEVLLGTAVPLAQQQSGFRGFLRLSDERTGKGMTITLWESEAALQAGEASGYIQEIRAKTGPFYVMPPFQEVFEVSLDVMADGTIIEPAHASPFGA